jgi:hypothetical protein
MTDGTDARGGATGDQAADHAPPEKWIPPFSRPGVRVVGAIGSDASEEQIAAFVERLNAQFDAIKAERAQREQGSGEPTTGEQAATTRSPRRVAARA